MLRTDKFCLVVFLLVFKFIQTCFNRHLRFVTQTDGLLSFVYALLLFADCFVISCKTIIRFPIY